ncbi:MAG: TolC family protein [Gemmataceae bacterium]
MSRYSWTTLALRICVLAGLGGVVGCKQQIVFEPGDHAKVMTASLPPNLESNVHDAIMPPLVDRPGGSLGPATVLDPTRPPRFMTLRECIAIALEQGNVGSQNPNQFGFGSEQLPGFNFGVNNSTDSIRAFAIDPGYNQASIERSLSRFDVRWLSSMTWQKVDQPVAAQFLSFQQQRDAASFNTSLVKPLPSGGYAGVTFSVDYSKFSQSSTQAGFVNPNYTPRVQFSFEQPLLQLFGVEVNQITPANLAPRSQLIQGVGPTGGAGGIVQGGTDGILIARVRADQSRSQFEAAVNYLLANVESAYWNLYAAYYNLYAREEGLRQSYEGYRFTAARVPNIDPPQQLDQARAQLELFRGQVITTRGQVLESERQLRKLLGLRSDDGQRIVPADEPNLAPFSPDFYEAAQEAVTYRPELMLARQEVKIQQLNLLLARNLRRPNLTTFAQYDVAGLGTRLDGSELIGAGGTTPGNAFASLGNNQFNSWTLGLRLDMPIGFRDANAQVRQQTMTLTRNYLQLRDAELKAVEYLIQKHRRVAESYALIGPARARREALQQFVARVRIRIEIGSFQSADYFNYLQVQRDLADSIAQEFQFIAQYNSALAEFEFAKGTIQRYNSITMAEGPLPQFVRERAADHERARVEAAIKLRERPAADPAPHSPPHNLGPAGPAPGGLPQLLNMPAGPDVNAVPQPDVRPGVPAPLPQPTAVPPPGPGAAAPRPLPTAQPAPVANPAGTPEPGAFFTPSGTVTVPRFQPIAPTTSPVPAPEAGPSGSRPTVPLLPSPDASGIPASLPPSGVPPVNVSQ